jgi:hypothetical protein
MSKKILLISGKLQSGKNQIAEYIQEILEDRSKQVTQDLFAKTLKNNCEQDFSRLTDHLNATFQKLMDYIEPDILKYGNDQFIIDMFNMCKEHITTSENYYENKNPITRLLLQTYGTDIFRDRVDFNYWVIQLINRIKESSFDYTLITDVRFPNEIDVIKSEDNIDVMVIRIHRKDNNQTNLNEHESEKALDNYTEWDLVIDNNGSLDELKQAALNICNNLLNNNQQEK